VLVRLAGVFDGGCRARPIEQRHQLLLGGALFHSYCGAGLAQPVGAAMRQSGILAAINEPVSERLSRFEWLTSGICHIGQVATATNSPARACVGPEANRTRKLDQASSPVTQSHRPARLATRAASFRSGGRHHSGIPGGFIPLYPGDFVGIRNRAAMTTPFSALFRFHRETEYAIQSCRSAGLLRRTTCASRPRN
jgi:hypothetical protein